ncbi:MAG: hypothetical protein ACYCY1_12630 [Sulfuriferula sp.]
MTRFLLPVAWERYRDSVDFSRKSDSTQKTELTRIKPVLAVLGEYSLLAPQEAPRLIYDYIDQRSKVIMTRSIGCWGAVDLALEKISGKSREKPITTRDNGI